MYIENTIIQPDVWCMPLNPSPWAAEAETVGLRELWARPALQGAFQASLGSILRPQHHTTCMLYVRKQDSMKWFEATWVSLEVRGPASVVWVSWKEFLSSWLTNLRTKVGPPISKPQNRGSLTPLCARGAWLGCAAPHSADC